MVNTKSEWNPRTQILRTELTGPITVDDVTTWRLGLGFTDDLPDPTIYLTPIYLTQVDFDLPRFT